jgi:hypothetical protein
MQKHSMKQQLLLGIEDSHGKIDRFAKEMLD